MVQVIQGFASGVGIQVLATISQVRRLFSFLFFSESSTLISPTLPLFLYLPCSSSLLTSILVSSPFPSILGGVANTVCFSHASSASSSFLILSLFLCPSPASVIAFILLVQFIAASIGDSIAGAIWTNFLPGLLRDELPDASQAVLDGLFADIFTIPGFGNPVRDGMVRSYMTIM